jgi:predicted metal-dependent hydrolase
MRLLSKVIVKDVSEFSCFVLDLEEEDDIYLKCEDVFAELMQHIHRLENFTEKSLIEFLKSKYPDVEDAQLQTDVRAFIQFLREKKFLAE